MSARAPAARGKADANHLAIKQAIELLGFPVMDLSAAGNGVEDLLVGLRIDGAHVVYRSWLLVECKVPDAKGKVRYKPAQLAWQNKTADWPRITVTSAQDAVDQLRRMTGG